MKITRAPRPPRGWFDMQNSTARDTNISFRALGILAHLLSHADGFTINADSLASKGGREGRDSIRNAYKELRAARYMLTERRQNERGRWITETLVFDTPQPIREGEDQAGKPTTGKPTTGKPTTGKPPVGRSGAKNKKATNKKKQGEEPIKTTTTGKEKSCGGGDGAGSPPRLDEVSFLGVIEDLAWPPFAFDDTDGQLEEPLRNTLMNEPAARVLELAQPGALQEVLEELDAWLFEKKIRNPAGWLRAVVRDAAAAGQFVRETI